MKKKLLSTFIIGLITLGLQGQSLNWELSVPPNARNVYDVKFVSGNKIFVFGGNQSNDSISTIAKTEDAGLNWKVLKDRPNMPLLKDAHILEEKTIIVVGEAGEVLRSIDTGKTFTKISLPKSVNNRKLNSVYFTNATHGFIAGGNPSNDAITTLLESKDAGATWSIIKDGLGPMLNDVYFYDKDNGIAVGNNGLVMKTADAGATWTTVTISGNAGTRTLNSVHFATNSKGFIVGGHPSNDSIQTILKTTDGGASWSTEKDNVNPMLQDVYFHTASIGMIVGNNGAVLETKDGGDNWTSVTLPGVNDKWFFTSVHYLNDSNAIIGGLQGAVFIANAPFKDNTNIGLSPAISNTLLFPNPAKNEFEIKGDLNNIKQVEVIDNMGKKVHFSIKNNRVNIETLSSGVYHVVVGLESGETLLKKLIIE